MTKNATPMRRYLLILLSLILIMSVSACTKEANTHDVIKISDEFFTALIQKNYDKALTYYSKDFFSLMPAESWVNRLKEINGKLGDLQEVKLKSENTSTVFSGRRFIFVYANRYKNGLARETLVFFQSVSNPEIKIQSHKIESNL
ncbi:MAG: hypothetical protein GXP19_07575, partial [Gammaproteobacteria bacterium]|nr:hypothetical protein [Gammaproteobacteria bacterium]